MIARRWFPSLIYSATFAATLLMAPPSSAAQQDGTQPTSYGPAAERALRHTTAEWLLMAPHLPDSATGTAVSLEVAADVLRARRMPEDALEYYGYALARGGDEARIRNRIGVTQLELRRPELARISFKRVLTLKRKDAEGWNNLGATEYIFGNFQGAIADYKRAVKLNKKGAIFHSNLGTAYFELKDYESARAQFDAALKLDKGVFTRGGWAGVQAHILSPKDRGRFCFEMAKMAARHGEDTSALQWLAQASEMGVDIRSEMAGDKDFAVYHKDLRVALIVRNSRAMRARQIAGSGPTPALAAETPKIQ